MDTNVNTQEDFKQFLSTFSNGENITIESIYKRKDRSTFPVEITITQLDTKSGIQVLGLARDITKRKEQEFELRHLRNYLNNIIDSMPSMLIGLDLQGNITHWNKSAEKNTKIDLSQAKGKHFTNIFPELVEVSDKILESINHCEIKHLEKKVRQYENHILYEDITIYPLSIDTVGGVVILIDDVTNRVKLEDMMIQTEKMVSVGTLAAGMAHEINNPLAGILQGVQNIQRRLSREISKNIEQADKLNINFDNLIIYMEERNIFKFIQGIKEAGLRASTIVSNMLQFSYRNEIQKSLIDINDLIERVIILAGSDYDLQKKYDFRYIEIVRDFDKSLPKISITVTEIEQVLLNLFKNSAQVMSDSDTENSKIFIQTSHENNKIKIIIEDNGPGMSEEVRKRAFEPFFTTKEVGIGTGLGLSVSYMIITNNHNGNIFIESILGKGTRFIIYLPLN